MALVGLCASAQEKGDMAAGLNLGVAPFVGNGVSTTNFGLGAKFQYNVSDPVRVEADLDYWFKSQGTGVLDASVNIHYLFKLADKLTFYPVFGIGYGRIISGASGSGDFDFDEDWDDDFPWFARTRAGYEDYFEGLEDYFSGSSNKNSGINRFSFNVGLGAEYAITDKLSVGAEFKYQYMKNYGRQPITIGVTYKF